MNIVIVGLGNVGEKVLYICNEKKLNVKATVAPHNKNATHKQLEDVSLEKDDIIIDFSHPSCVLHNVEIYGKNKCNVIMGTAGWEDQKPEIDTIIRKSGIMFITSHNFMERVQNFWKTLEVLLKGDNYDYAEVTEIRVKDASKEYSSTAFHTTEIIAKGLHKTAQRKQTKNAYNPEIIFLESHQNGKNHLDISISLFSREGQLDLHFIIGNADEANQQYAQGAVELIKKITKV